MKKRILSLILSVCMLLSGAVLFSSCAKKTIDFANGYSVVYGEDMSMKAANEVKALANTLKEKTGTDVAVKKVQADKEIENEADYEILVGNTNRPETERVLKKIKGQGYAIKAVGKKIVIVGTTNLLTSMAVDEFVKTYVANAESVSKITLQKVESYNMEMLEITTKTSFVYSSHLEGQGDYVINGINSLKAVMSSASDVRGAGMNMIKDEMSAKAEILVGVVNREETKSILANMDADNYALAVRNGKLVITAFNDTVLANAIEAASAMLSDAVYYDEDADTKQIFIPANYTRIYSVQFGFVTDFPRPQGLTLTGTIDVHNDNMLFAYESDNITPENYEAYCADLVKAGYRLYTDSGEPIEGNIFRTYVNETAGVMLYVAYNPYHHAEKQGVETKKKIIRIISSKLEKADLIPEEMLTQNLNFERLQNSAITAVRLDYVEDAAAGQLEIMTLEDGSFIIIDGGNKTDRDVRRIYEILIDLYKRGHNEMMPTNRDPLRIVAWYNTHSHGDHIGSTIKFIDTYCKDYARYSITIDYLIANFPADEGYYNTYRGDKNANTTVRDDMAEYSAKIQDAPGEQQGMQFIRVRTGQKFYIANVEFEVMFTHEDHYPGRMNSYNETCTVIRSTMHHTENGVITEGASTSVMWLGDAYPISASYMRAMYGSYLKSDIVQMSHHGTGADWGIYTLIKPKCVIIPNKRTSYASSLAKDGHLMQKISEDLKTVEYVVVSDVANYTFSLTKTGINYAVGGRTGVFSAGDSATVSLQKVSTTAPTGYFYTKYKTN